MEGEKFEEVSFSLTMFWQIIINLVTFYFIFYFLVVLCSMWYLSSPSSDQAHAPGGGSAES